VNVSVAVKASLLLALVFTAGVASGVLYERRDERPHHAVPADAHDLLHGLTRELDLTAAQQQTINEIVARHQREVDSNWQSMRPRVHAALDAAVQEILSVLTPEQATKFRKLAPRHSDARH
jgi:Spy/CpxP family protein refolding chaperone